MVSAVHSTKDHPFVKVSIFWLIFFFLVYCDSVRNASLIYKHCNSCNSVWNSFCNWNSLLICFFIYYLLFGYTATNFGPLSKISLANPILITTFLKLMSTQRSLKSSWRGWVPKPDRVPSRVWTRNLLILNVKTQPTWPLSPYILWKECWFIVEWQLYSQS